MQDFKGKAFVAGFGVFVLAIVLYSVFDRPAEEDPITGCPAKGGSDPVSILIVDQSDTFEKGDREIVDDRLQKILDAQRKDERLVVLGLNAASGYEPRLLFEKCAPKPHRALSELTENVEELDKRQAAFRSSFTAALDAELRRDDLPKSPILETLSYASHRPDFAGAEVRRIYVMSDFLQNYGALSFYRGVPPANAVTDESLRSDPISLKGTQTYLIPIVRRGLWASHAKVRTFWTNWLVDRGAQVQWLLPDGTSSAVISSSSP